MVEKDKEVITVIGERDLWIDFVSKIKKDRKTVWEVLEKLIKEYLGKK
jgi:hypothetical protein